jgi:hypothetical protein
MSRGMALRVIGFLGILAALAASAYTFTGKARSGELNPVEQVDAMAARGELASAQYVLGIVAGQLAQVKVVDGTYDAELEFGEFPLVTLVRADDTSYCLEFRKTHTFFLAGPGGTVAAGTCR